METRTRGEERERIRLKRRKHRVHNSFKRTLMALGQRIRAAKDSLGVRKG